MVRTAGSSLLDDLSGAEASNASSAYRNNPRPNTADSEEQRRIQGKYGAAGSDQLPAEGSAALAKIQRQYGQTGSNPRSKQASSLFKRAGNFLLKKKFAISGGSAILIILVVVVLFVLSLLKIPSLAADITSVEFTRLFRQFSNTALRLNEEALAYQTASREGAGKSISLRQLLQDEYKGERTLLDKLIGVAKRRGLSPDEVADNLRAADNIRLNYAPGDNVLKSISLVDESGTAIKTVAIPEATAVDRIIPGWRLFTKTLSGQDSRLGSQLADLISLGLKGEGTSRISLIIRGSGIAELFRKAIGANLFAFDAAALNRFRTMDRQQADAAELQESFDDVSHGTRPEIKSTVPGEEEATKAAEDVIEHGAHDAAQVAQPKKLLAKAGDAARAIFARDGPIQKVVKVADPLYLLAMTMCTVYEGSLERSGGAINANVKHQELIFNRTAAIASQVTAGGSDPGLANADQGANDQYGDFSDSIPFRKASGLEVNTNNSIASAEADAMGEFTLINASLPQNKLGQALANMINPVGDKVCGGLLSPAGVIAAIGVQVAILVGTLGAGTAPDAAATAGTEALADSAVGDLSSQVAGRSIAAVIGQKIAVQGFWKRVGAFLFKEGAKLTGILVGTDLLTFGAQWWVYMHSGYLFSGLETDTDLADAAGAGGNLTANEHGRAMLFGRPLTCAEVDQNDQLDKTYLAQQDAAGGFATRYLSLDNPRSLLARSASTVQAATHNALGENGTLASFLQLPAHTLASLIGSISGIAAAATPCAQVNYGNVQFGWSKDEEALIDSSDSYLPLQNQKILDESKKAAAIAEDYSYCFGYDYNSGGDGSFDPTDPNSDLIFDITGENAPEGKDGSLGGLLSNGDIVRTANGDVVAGQGHCSPNELGIHNAKYGDLVFRWRLAGRYDTTLSNLTNLQTVTQ